MQAAREFFLSDQLGQVSPLARLLYIGMHLLADDLDRVPYRPMWIKAQLLPYDKGDSDDTVILLDELHDEELIKYVGENGETIQLLPYWKYEPELKKQKPVSTNNTKEKKKHIPGQPSSVHEWMSDPDKVRQIQGWVSEGISTKELIARLGIATGTFYYWKKISPEFAALLDPKSKEEAQSVPEVSRPIATEMEVAATVLPSVDVPRPEKAAPGYLEWLNDPKKAAQIREWASKRLLTSEIAKRMGVSASVLTQWKVMSNEFAALFAPPPKKIRSQRD